jgi:hypothetical protein
VQQQWLQTGGPGYFSKLFLCDLELQQQQQFFIYLCHFLTTSSLDSPWKWKSILLASMSITLGSQKPGAERGAEDELLLAAPAWRWLLCRSVSCRSIEWL